MPCSCSGPAKAFSISSPWTILFAQVWPHTYRSLTRNVLQTPANVCNRLCNGLSVRHRAEQDESALDLLVTLLPAIQTYDVSAASRLWPPFAAACSQCLPCALALHSLHTALEEQSCIFAEALIVQRAECVEAALKRATTAALASGSNGSSLELGTDVVHALLEALLFHTLLRDQGSAPPASIQQGSAFCARDCVLLLHVHASK